MSRTPDPDFERVADREVSPAPARLPCPWCGGAYLDVGATPEYCFVSCGVCQARGPNASQADGAWARWNSRAKVI